MGEVLEDKCGICVAHTLHDAYTFIKRLQHRGRDATGIGAIGNNRMDVIKWIGEVETFDLVDLYKILPSEDYHTYVAHVRYATRGKKDTLLEDAHPHVVGGKHEDKGSHVLISDCDMLAVHNGQFDSKFYEHIDKKLLKTGCDTEAILHLFSEKGEIDILKNIPGSFTMAIADKKRKDVMVLRDRLGMKPGVLGLKDGKYVVASEDFALHGSEGQSSTFIEDLTPGSVYYLKSDGGYYKQCIAEPTLKQCFFEWNYIANVNSIINGVSVGKLRALLGEQLAREFNPPDATIVTYLPRCPEVAARTYAQATGKKFMPTMYKMRGTRAFLGATDKEREKSIRENLHLNSKVKASIRGETVVSIDDSTVRGNNSKRERELLYDFAGVAKSYHTNYTPQIGIIGTDGQPRGCNFGVDMPPNPPPEDMFIARGRTSEQISELQGMPTCYISLEGMLKTFERAGIPRRTLCYYCIGGEHPFESK